MELDRVTDGEHRYVYAPTTPSLAGPVRPLVLSIPSERVESVRCLVRPPFDPIRLFPNRIDPRAGRMIGVAQRGVTDPRAVHCDPLIVQVSPMDHDQRTVPATEFEDFD